MAHFKTAYLQREIVVDAKVAKDLKVGDIVAATMAANGTDVESITAAASAADADYIVAQSDMTMDRRDYTKNIYEYSDVVKQSSTAKKVALFPVYEVEDIILDGSETK